MIDDLIYALKTKFGFGLQSRNWKHWFALLDLKTCEECRKMHGKIYAIDDKIRKKPPRYMYCRCEIKPMNAAYAEDCTKQETNGAPYWLKMYGCLPGYYITSDGLQMLGWKWGKSPSKYAPGKMATMGIYRNDNGHLPTEAGRIWYEADINYISGKGNAHRVVWSNDGLIFVTYDHYKTFVEVV